MTVESDLLFEGEMRGTDSTDFRGKAVASKPEGYFKAKSNAADFGGTP